jgi:HK97 family phage major capsid protein/HK97 family phage prohead protease
VDLSRELNGKQLRRFEAAEFRSLEDERSLEFSFSSELPVKRWFGDEVLSHDPAAVDLQRLNDGAPVLWNHDPDRVIGVVERAWIDGEKKRGMVRVKFSRNSAAEDVVRDVSDGILRNISTGYVIAEAENRGEQVVATNWQPYEVSVVACPADNSVGIGRAFDPGTPAAAETNPVNPPMDDITPSIAEVRAQAAAEERTRVAEITKICRQHEIDPTDLIERGATEADAMKQVLTVIAERGAKQPAQPKASPVVPQPVASSANIGLTDKETRGFSFVRAINALANPGDARARDAAGFELEVSRAVEQRTGRQAQGILVPNEVMQRDLTVGTASAAGDLVSTDYKGESFIELLRNRMALNAVGITTLTGLTGPVAIPRQTAAATAYWLAEKAAPTESNPTVDQINMSPKTVGAYTDFSRRLMLQSSLDVEQMVRRELATVLALEIDRVGLYGLGNTSQPLGLRHTTGINTVDFGANQPIYSELVQMETEIAADNADIGSMAYITTATIYGGFKTTEKATGTAQFVLESGGTVNGYPVVRSNQVASNDVWFGVWSQMILGLFSGLDLTVDPYVNSTAGGVRVIALQDVDYAVKRPEFFCRGNNTL